jgi:hypothetical protein
MSPRSRPDRFRADGQRVRALAAEKLNLETQRLLLKIADEYEVLAKTAGEEGAGGQTWGCGVR